MNVEKRVYWLINRRVMGFRLMLLHGAFAWELQVGTLVVQWFYKGTQCRQTFGQPLRVWTDEFGSRRMS
jgi:hypothetical protein